MKFRKLNQFIAYLGGYFWLPCPLCGQHFGGHEWSIGIEPPSSTEQGKGICPDCTKAGKGYRHVISLPEFLAAIDLNHPADEAPK